MYKLVISDDDGHTTVVPLLRDEITIGRQEGNAIRLTERNVSRSHARLLKRNGSYIVEDLGSYNGVTVNGERIDAKAKLATGDHLVIGDYDLAFQSDIAATANTLPSPKPKSQPPPRLVVLSELAAGAEFTLTKPALRIGRDERLDIWINHKSISHEHAELQVNDGKVTVYDLESANGIRVNGVKTSRAVLDAGDILELGEVRFRFLPPQGAHSLEPLPQEVIDTGPSSSSRKSVFVLSVLGLLTVAGAGAVLVTMGRTPVPPQKSQRAMVAIASPGEGTPSTANPTRLHAHQASPIEAAPSTKAATADTIDADPDDLQADAPQEWEAQLARAGSAMAAGRIDRAFAIADAIPEDSVLRDTPEFGEIRYRYIQSRLSTAEHAFEVGDAEAARVEAGLVLRLEGVTSKQRRDARRLMREARQPVQGIDAKLTQARACAARGDHRCVVRALEGHDDHGPAALALLIESYRAVGEFTPALQHMQTFVKLYPDDERTPKYLQLLTGQ